MKTLLLTLTALLMSTIVNTAFTQNWWAQNSGTTNKLRNINFYDNNTGFSFGDTLSTAISTSDQGGQWNALNPSFTAGDLSSSAFLSSSTIIAVGKHDVTGGDGLVMLTTNGGTSWAADVTLPEKLFDVSFANSTDGWISGENGYIARTTDAGSNWLKLTTGTEEDIFSIYFIDANQGWAVGTVNTNSVVLQTTNSGTNWTAQTSGITEALFSVFFVDALNGWAMGAAGKIISTTDGGSNWSEQTSGVTNDLFDVNFINANKGWAVGGSGTVLKTTDGGANWATEASGTTQDIHSIHMRNESLGWFCGDGGVIHVYAMNPTDIHETSFNEVTIDIYPNPSTDWVSIRNEHGNTNWSIALYDLEGKKLLQGKIITGNIIRIRKGRMSGLYLLKISDNKGSTFYRKVIFN